MGKDENNRRFKQFVILFDELLNAYKETKKKLLFETEYGIDEKKALQSAVNRFKKRKETILTDNVL